MYINTHIIQNLINTLSVSGIILTTLFVVILVLYMREWYHVLSENKRHTTSKRKKGGKHSKKMLKKCKKHGKKHRGNAHRNVKISKNLGRASRSEKQKTDKCQFYFNVFVATKNKNQAVINFCDSVKKYVKVELEGRVSIFLSSLFSGDITPFREQTHLLKFLKILTVAKINPRLKIAKVNEMLKLKKLNVKILLRRNYYQITYRLKNIFKTLYFSVSLSLIDINIPQPLKVLILHLRISIYCIGAIIVYTYMIMFKNASGSFGAFDHYFIHELKVRLSKWHKYQKLINIISKHDKCQFYFNVFVTTKNKNQAIINFCNSVKINVKKDVFNRYRYTLFNFLSA